MVHKTKGIVIRTVKYGETSVIVAIYTELFGLQSYIVNGVRMTSKKGSSKAALFQPPAILDMEVYHNELKNLQRIKEYKWAILYQNIFFHIVKNAVALFMVELLQKCLKQPEPNPDLYNFIEDAFLHLDKSGEKAVGNFPLFFALHLPSFFGIRIQDNFSERRSYLDLREGLFIEEQPRHPDFLEGEFSYLTAQLLRVMVPDELSEIQLNQEKRRILLHAYQTFYVYHVQEFNVLKSLPVLQAILSDS